jgi:hypothetical protein
MPTETDVLCSGRDPMVAAQDDDRINHPPTDASTARHDEVLLQQSSTHPLPVATRHRSLKLAHRGVSYESSGRHSLVSKNRNRREAKGSLL